MSADPMINQVSWMLGARAAVLRTTIENNLARLLQAWLLLAGLGSAARIAASPPADGSAVALLAPYALLIAAPAVSLWFAARWFSGACAQPRLRLARVGRWRSVSRDEARRHPLYGPDGLMVSVLVGMLLNIPLRLAEYLAAMPALASDIPPWLAVLRAAMTIDVVVMTSLYAVAFVAALKRAPMFPRLLVSVWLADFAMQWATATLVAAEPDLPPRVADSLQTLVEGNVAKLLVSVALWAPYLLLSKRVNVTYRHRVPA